MLKRVTLDYIWKFTLRFSAPPFFDLSSFSDVGAFLCEINSLEFGIWSLEFGVFY